MTYGRAELIVLDEPTLLDVPVRAEVIDLPIALQEEFELSYLFISHDPGAPAPRSRRAPRPASRRGRAADRPGRAAGAPGPPRR
jgi:hypothetical protein